MPEGRPKQDQIEHQLIINWST